jgi:hypothetical protein
MIDIPEDLDKEVAIFKAKNGFSSKEDAIRYVLSKYFKIKFLDAYKENDGDDVSIKRGL